MSKILHNFLSDSILPSESSVFIRHLEFGTSRKHDKRRGSLLQHQLVKKVKFQKPQTVYTEFAKKIRFADRLIKRSKKINIRNKIDIYSIPLINSTGTCSKFKRFYFGNPDKTTEQRTILVMGTDGSSKAKFINGIINFVFNVEQEDNFRFQLIEEEKNQPTNCIEIYDIYHSKGFRVPYSLTIALSPCFSDSINLELFKNQRIAESLKELMENTDGIRELDMICNLMDTNESNGTNLLDFSIFGKDVVGNIKDYHPYSCLDGTCSWITITESFFVVLNKKNKMSLSLTKLVLQARKQIEDTIMELQSLIKIVHSKKNEIEQAKQMVKFCETQIVCNNRTKDDLLLEFNKKMDLPVSEYVNNCNNSYVFRNACIKEEKRKGNYSVYSSDLNDTADEGFCSFYQVKCSLILHSNQPCRLAYIKKETNNMLDQVGERSSAEMKLKNIKLKYQNVIKVLQKHLDEDGTVMLELFQTAWQCIKLLNKMALNGNSFLTKEVFYFIFEAERQLKEFGFQFHLNGDPY